MIRAIVVAFAIVCLTTSVYAIPTKIVSMTTPIGLGKRGPSDPAIAQAGSHCNIEVIDAWATPSPYPNLLPKKADAQGFVRWAFTLRDDANVGTYRVTIRTSTPVVGKAPGTVSFTKVNFVVVP